MGENSKIEWTHHTFNPWRGCTKVSAGCDNCYAEKMSGRNPKTLGVWGKHGSRVVASDAMWREPLKWNRAAEQAGERHRVFCASLADVFEGDETIPESAVLLVKYARRRLFKLIQAIPNLDWLLLTKRPENVFTLTYEAIDPNHEDNAWNEIGEPNGLSIFPLADLYPNVWIGTSVEDQKTADERIPHLLQIPAKVRFLSIEPLLGPVDLSRWLRRTLSTDERNSIYEATGGMEPYQLACQTAEGENGFQWVIVGGESGPNARPMHPDWVRSIRDQCQAAGVPFFFKQWGNYAAGCQLPPETVNLALNHSIVMNSLGEITDIADDQGFDNNIRHFHVGKKLAGRRLDGREWNELPEATR